LAIRFALVVLFGGLLGGCRQQGTLAGLPPGGRAEIRLRVEGCFSLQEDVFTFERGPGGGVMATVASAAPGAKPPVTIALDDGDLAAIDAQLVQAAGPATAGCTLVTTYDVTIVAAGAATKQHLVDRSCQPRKDRRGRVLQELAQANL
jgi:hypothetical protein